MVGTLFLIGTRLCKADGNWDDVVCNNVSDKFGNILEKVKLSILLMVYNLYMLLLSLDLL